MATRATREERAATRKVERRERARAVIVNSKRNVAGSIVESTDTVRRSVRADRGKVKDAIIGRGNPSAPFSSRDYERARRDLSQVVRRSFVGQDAPVKKAMRDLITRAAGDKQTARQLLTERNEFGRTINQELARARARFERRMRRVMRDAIKRGESKESVARTIVEAWDKQTDATRVAAWHAARAANTAALNRVIAAGQRYVEVVLSHAHKDSDLCDDLAGRYTVETVTLPPFHPHCKCFVRAFSPKSPAPAA